jgi:hypothetical protein
MFTCECSILKKEDFSFERGPAPFVSPAGSACAPRPRRVLLRMLLDVYLRMFYFEKRGFFF